MGKQKTALVVSAVVLALSGMGQVVYAQAAQERGDGPGSRLARARCTRREQRTGSAG